MNNQETILQLEELKLKGMAEFYKSMQSLPANEWPSIDLFAARMAEAERQYRSTKKTDYFQLPRNLKAQTIVYPQIGGHTCVIIVLRYKIL